METRHSARSRIPEEASTIASILLIHNGSMEDEQTLQALIDATPRARGAKLRDGVWRLESNNLSQMLIRDARNALQGSTLEWFTVENDARRSWSS